MALASGGGSFQSANGPPAHRHSVTNKPAGNPVSQGPTDCFNTLARGGSSGFDGEGVSDLAEFLGGTDPTNSNSVFRVLTVASAGGGGKLVMWAGNPARSYRVESKDDLGAASWKALSGTISWNGSTASITDSGAGGATNRYYRVVRLP